MIRHNSRWVIESMFLYRALCPEEISRCVLIPKNPREPFVAHPMLPQVSPFDLGERPEHAVRAQQWDGRYPTSGVSTTPHLKRAKYYAQHHRTGSLKQSGEPTTIATIAVECLATSGIHTFQVSEHVHSSLIFAPKDDEIILVCPNAESFPKEIIVNIFEAGYGVT